MIGLVPKQANVDPVAAATLELSDNHPGSRD